jgi:hypothetical protein
VALKYMYSRFLREAAEITSDDRLIALTDEFQRIGDRWQMVADTCKRAAEAEDPAAALPEIDIPLLELADLEEAAWSGLGELVQ